ncbi:MAG: 50S ribosomal protein L21 [Pelagibacteraceae bacterium]|nr:50S ribosomal protein L21 [Pelagibacteraceae bacterium]OUV88910.1 MAG: 50S ribosomal protein L21 [Pelagibacteraceae bacterium TMED146]
MTFAVINTGGKQYKVSANDKLRIEKLPQEEGKSIEFKEVLLINNNQDMELGSPLIDGAKVEGKIVKQAKNKTVLIFKKRRRHNSRRKNGHRQKMSVVQITKIFGKGGKLLSEAKKTEVNKDKTTTKKSA